MYRNLLFFLLIATSASAFAGKKHKIRGHAQYVLENIHQVHDHRDLKEIKALLQRASFLTQQALSRQTYRPGYPVHQENQAIGVNDSCRTLVRKNYAPHYAKEQCEPIKTHAQLSCMKDVIKNSAPHYAKDVCKGLTPRQVKCVKDIMKNYAPHYAREQCI